MENLLYKDNTFPLIGFDIYNSVGKKVKIKSRCELCAFAEVDEDFDALKCTKTQLLTLDGDTCDKFNITLQMMDDIYHGLIK